MYLPVRSRTYYVARPFICPLATYESEEFTIYIHREPDFIICGAVPPLDQYAFMACYFTTDLI